MQRNDVRTITRRIAALFSQVREIRIRGSGQAKVERERERERERETERVRERRGKPHWRVTVVTEIIQHPRTFIAI